MLRPNHYGAYWEGYFDADGDYPIDVSAQVTFDTELGCELTDSWHVAIGAQNMLNLGSPR